LITYRRWTGILIGFMTSLSGSAFVSAQPRDKAPIVPEQLAPGIELRQPGVRLTLLAEHPSLVTPTGIDVGPDGRIWLVACHTHFRTEEYRGPIHDEILVFDKDGKNRQVFYNQTDATMHVELGPDGWVYLAERDRILRVKDTDGDGVADLEENLAKLDTVADYPHNGLSGMAWHPDGGLVFSLGENFSKDWTLTASDGLQCKGRGEGGVFRCSATGTGLRRIAQGFWNPFGLLVRDDGEIFAAENDPGSRPPCRLLNIVEGADYGYQRVYGNAPIHPFVGWNGELRGTIGMVHPSGEAPCAIVELGGGVLIPSWSNHNIDYFPLVRKGAGYTSQRIELVHGSDFFRPVGLAPSPDGSFYLTDWVFSSYQVHGRGRLWKLEIDSDAATWLKNDREPMNDMARLAKEIREGHSQFDQTKLFELARSSDRYLSDAALGAIARSSHTWTPELLASMATQDRLWAIVALRRVDLNEEKWVRAMWNDPDLEIRFECLRWISDAVMTSFSMEVEQVLNDPKVDYRLFEAALATWNTLRGNPEAGLTDPETMANRVADSSTPVRLKAYALRLLPASDKRLSVSLLRKLLAENDLLLSTEVVRTLAARNAIDSTVLLADIAESESYPPSLRADAIAGLASSASVEHFELLMKLVEHENGAIREESLRAIRFRPLSDTNRSAVEAIAKRYPEVSSLANAALDATSINSNRPALSETEHWLKRLDAMPGEGRAEVGRSIFFHSKIALCANCHRHSGRGNVVGPDLSLIAQQGDRASMLKSILEPNREVAPQYYATLLELDDGSVFSGILLRSSNRDVFRDITGKERTIENAEVVRRKELTTSLMPTGLIEQLTDLELRDLLTFLASPSF